MSKKKFKLAGLTGEVFNNHGKVAGVIPPMNLPDAFPFRVERVLPQNTRAGYPEWADMLVQNRIWVRINPDICSPPFFRLFDIVALVARQEKKLFALADGTDDKFWAEFQGQVFILWPQWISERMGRVMMVDTMERLRSWIERDKRK